MTYASIMVAMDLTSDARDRARVAAQLADLCRARLIGVAADIPAYVVPPIGPTPGSAYVLPLSKDMVSDDLRLAEVVFEEAVEARSRVSWRASLELPLPFLVAQAAAADLVVLGRAPRLGQGLLGQGLFSVDPADVLMELGVPALIVPPGIDRLDPQRIAIGWKNTRETRRAVRDALPFLRRASHVDVIAIDEGYGAAETTDVIGFLRAQSIAANTVAKDASGATVGEALIAAASDCAADVIVTGAYGHGRLREWVFGGVTRTLLVGSPLCCLMSH